MIAFEVNDMTCGHCAGSITEALKAVDGQAKFTVDPTRHLVTIESTDVDPNKLRDAIEDAGYTPVRVEEGTVNACAQATSCCGQQH
ncbi:Heavy metal transport/detoxification protein [Paraburkholderia ribeironis]|uniref:Heavy metal transport/detoxification protein n=1 Tax=Paraburkholderia ribeironis TaxID=1247936 RepID=A0A1N7SLW4_9BURK|nr:heavy-metal-associated domain-containing protein [Paraburkholderia ribeironis]SIT48405.1 Heavy metal transport/detoxification protein [Paraburkholderia ribeironis]